LQTTSSVPLRGALLLVAVAAAGCAHYAVRPMPGAPAIPALRSAQAGVELTVSEPRDAYAAFDADLRASGVFPVLLQVANHSAQAVTVSPRTLKLTGQGASYRLLGPGDVSERIQYSPAAHYFSWGYGLLGLGVVPGTVDHFRAEAANRDIWRDLRQKSLGETTASAGGMVRGFVYFEVPESTAPLQLTALVTTSDGGALRYVVDFPAGSR